MKLVGIIGNSGAGKDTVADILHNQYNFDKFSFAGILKEGCKTIFGLTDDQVYGNKKEEVDAFWQLSSREILQYVGTELFREGMGKLMKDQTERFWIMTLERKLKDLNYWDQKDERVVISDVRFANEIDWILDNKGIIIYVKRPKFHGDVGISQHPSENLVEAIKNSQLKGTMDRIFGIWNNSTIEKLEEEVRNFSIVYGLN